MGKAGEAVMLSLDEGISQSVASLLRESVPFCFGEGCTKLVTLGVEQAINVFKRRTRLNTRHRQATRTRYQMRRELTFVDCAFFALLWYCR